MKVLTSPDNRSACFDRSAAAVSTLPAAAFRFARRLAHAADARAYLLRRLGRPPHVARDLRRGHALFLDGRGNGAGDRADALDGGGNASDGIGRLPGRGLDLDDLRLDLLRRLAGLCGEAFDLRRHQGRNPSRPRRPAPPRSWRSAPAGWSGSQCRRSGRPRRPSSRHNRPVRARSYRCALGVLGLPGR